MTPEIMEALLQQEETTYKTSDYLTRMQLQIQRKMEINSSPSASKKRKSITDEVVCVVAEERSEGTASTHINKHWREKICEWAYQVVDHFDLSREVVSVAMNHLDRFLDSFQDEIDKNTFQLLAMTCLYLSIKLNEYKHLLIPESKSSMDTILRLSRGAFTLEQMEKMEYEVLQRLRWHVHPPSPQLFVKHFLFFLSVDEHEIHDLTQFMIELSVMDYFFVSYKPSEIAMASLLNALDGLYPQSSANVQLSFLSQFMDVQSPSVIACRERLSLIYAQANDQGAGFSGGAYGKEPMATADSSIRTTSPTTTATVLLEDMDYAIHEETDEDYDYDDL